MIPKGSRVMIMDGNYTGQVGIVVSDSESFSHPQSLYKGCVEVRLPPHELEFESNIYAPDQLLQIPENATEDQIWALTHIICSR